MKIKPSGKLGRNLSRLVKQSGSKNLFQFTQETGFPWATSYRIITGETKNPSLDTMRQLAKALGLPLDKLFSELMQK